MVITSSGSTLTWKIHGRNDGRGEYYFVRDDPTLAVMRYVPDSTDVDVFLNPKARRSDGTFGTLTSADTLNVSVTFTDNSTDTGAISLAGTTISSQALPSLTPTIPSYQADAIVVNWDSQYSVPNQFSTDFKGDAHLTVSNLLTDHTVRAVTLSDAAGLTWVYRRDGVSDYHVEKRYDTRNASIPGDPATKPGYYNGYFNLAFVRTGTSSTADVYFPSFRNEANSRMTLRVVYDAEAGDNGVRPMDIAQFDAGMSDPSRRYPSFSPNDTQLIIGPSTTPDYVVLPGGSQATFQSVLNNPANERIRLQVGTYHLTKPLVIDQHSIEIRSANWANPNSTQRPSLVFTPFDSDTSPWRVRPGAINIATGNVSLNGFDVRFSESTISTDWRFAGNLFSDLRAVIRMPGGTSRALSGIQIVNMYIESPGRPIATPASGCLPRTRSTRSRPTWTAAVSSAIASRAAP
jgi:hypothetical protein